MEKQIMAFLVMIMVVAFVLLPSVESMAMDNRQGGGSEELSIGTANLAGNFKLRDINNIEVSLSDYKGKQSVLLFFWTTWCPFCVAELSSLNSKYQELKENSCELLAINIGESADKVIKYVQKYNPFFKVLLDKDNSVASSFDVLGVPTYVLINKKGEIVALDHRFPSEYKSLILE